MIWTSTKVLMPDDGKWVMTCMLIAGRSKYQRPAKWNGTQWIGTNDRPLIHMPTYWRNANVVEEDETC